MNASLRYGETAAYNIPILNSCFLKITICTHASSSVLNVFVIMNGASGLLLQRHADVFVEKVQRKLINFLPEIIFIHMLQNTRNVTPSNLTLHSSKT